MKLAVAYNKENGRIADNFNTTQYFMLYDIVDGEVLCSELVGTMKYEEIDLVGMLTMLEADALLCGGINEESIHELNSEGLVFYSGFEGDAEEVTEHFINGRFTFGKD